ncbi:Disulfide oxidoreductase YuzD [Sediminibacillus albus]|uniref:Disulfide oxidoreductase YuzD n=1 Tax=Sediminibacillus albus TaxID=407036 RepID=A0A1G8YZR1_9BACI|nr:YuzD family protein [Sediminibacillus albus]SDK07874.1 Disulfide oxidoreductase YuzD [Sediminibacillus albus]
MDNRAVKLTVYGADQICASCVNAPGSVETFEWLQAAIARKFEQASAIEFEYVDIFNPPDMEAHKQFVKRVQQEEFFYPVVLINGEVAGEGNPRLKSIFNILEKNGVH